MRRIINSLVIIGLFLASSGLALPAADASFNQQVLVNDVNSSDQGVSFDVQVLWRALQLETVAVADRQYTRISLPGLTQGTIPQAPDIPLIVENIAVPFGVTLQIEVIPGKAHRQQLPHPVLPVLTQSLDWPLPSEEAGELLFPTTRNEVIEDPAIYSANLSYPGILGELSNDGVMRQQRVAGLSLYPIQYQADTRELTIYEELHVRVAFSGRADLSRTPAQGESGAYTAFIEKNLLNYEDAQTWQAAENSARASTEGTPPWTPPDPGWRVKVRQDAFYALTYTDLLQAGLDVDNLDPRTLQLFHLGSEAAITVEGEQDSRFDPGDRVIFYGQSIKDKYTQDNVYWLTYGQQNGLRNLSRDVSPSEATKPGHYPEHLSLEQNRYYVSFLSGSDDLERYLWDFAIAPVVKPTWTYQFSLADPMDGAGQFEMLLAGYSSHASVNPDHHAIITLNGNQIGDLTWDGLNWKTLAVDLPVGSLLDGVNTITMTLPNSDSSAYDTIYVDWIKLEFERHFVATANKLAFTYDTPGAWQFQVDGFSSADLVGYDVSDPNAVVSLQNFMVKPDGLLYSLVFEDELAGTATYHITASSAYLPVWAIEADTPSNLRSTLNAADHITISHAALLGEAAVLTAFRASQGLRSKLVDVQDIYDEFGYGLNGAAPIRDFLAYAYANWAGAAPSYVVLVGDGHYDPKNYYGFGRQSYLPPYLAVADAGFGETAADNRYVSFIGEDTLPDMMLGRLAVNSPAEAKNFIDKIIAYEQAPVDQDWLGQVMVVSDNNDVAGTFIGSSQALVSCCLPSAYQPERIYLGVTHSVAAAQTAIRSGINEGRFLVNYIGHAGTSQWAGYDEQLFQNSDVPLLSNAGRYPVVLAMTCWEGYYINPQAQGGNYDALAEVLTKAQGKGAVASWSPTGVGVATGHDYLNRGFFNATFKSMVATIGQATIAGKLALWASGTYLDLIDTYLLFGDPATNFLRGLMALDDAYSIDEDTTLSVPLSAGVLVNDWNPESATLSAELVDDVRNGTLSLAADGSFTYTPALDFFGTDSFSYLANDGEFDSNIATVWIQVLPVNDGLPVAHDQDVSTNENTPLNITLTVSDDGGFGLTFEVLTQPASGILSGAAPNLVYTPNPGFIGSDSFTFKANDGEFDSNIATVRIEVLPYFPVFLPLIFK